VRGTENTKVKITEGGGSEYSCWGTKSSETRGGKYKKEQGVKTTKRNYAVIYIGGGRGNIRPQGGAGK